MTMKKTLIPVACALSLAGCFTVSQSPYPETAMTAFTGERSVAVTGFEATVVHYVTMYGEEMVYVPGHYGRHHYRPGYYHTVQTATNVPQAQQTDAFLEQAKDRLEESGFNLKASPADYVVDVKFSGPQTSSPGVRALWWLFSAFMCDNANQTWTAKLKIHDNRTGKLLFSRVYSQEYEATCFSPIPLFGPACHEETSPVYMQCWCLQALTDRATADASAFLGGIK